MKRKLSILGASVIAILTAGLSSIGLASLATGEFGFSEAFDQRAFAVLNEGRSVPKLAEAGNASRSTLQTSPFNNSARLRLAYIEAERLGHVGPEGLKALNDSYALMPIDHSVVAWRLRFALEHWSELTPEIRAAARYEALAFASVSWPSLNIRQILTSIEDPSGALAAAFILQEIS